MKKLTSSKRLSNFDTLRVLCAVMVIVEHFCETGMFGAFNLSPNISNQLFLQFLYSFSREAVDVFIILSGYFLIDSENQRIGKVVDLIAMTIFYSLFLYLLSCLVGVNEFSLTKFCVRLIPQNYFLFLYVSLYLISPYLNRIISDLTKKGYLHFLFILALLFTIWPTTINAITSVLNIKLIGVYTLGLSGTDMGFNIMTFILLYYIGGAIRKYTDGFDFKKGLIAFSFLTLGLFLSTLFHKNISKVFYYYDSVFIISQAASLTILFKRIQIKEISVLSFFAKKTYGVFLVHFFVLNMIDRFFEIKKMLIQADFCHSLFLTLTTIIAVYLISVLFVSMVSLTASIITKKWKISNLYNRKIFFY